MRRLPFLLAALWLLLDPGPLQVASAAAPEGKPGAEKSAADSKAGSGQPATDDKSARPAALAAPAATPAPATQQSREQALAALLPRLAQPDEAVWLEAGGQKFFAFRRKPAGKVPLHGTLLLVPGRGDYIDQLPVTRALRTLPPAGGIATYALQPQLGAPVAAAPAAPGTQPAEPAKPGDGAQPVASVKPPPGLCERLTAVLALARADNPQWIALAAESDAIEGTLACYDAGLPPEVKAFAAIGRWQGAAGTLKVPVIEFVPTGDPSALRGAERRAATPPPAGSPPRRRVDIDTRDRDFGGAAEEVAKRLRGWLLSLPLAPAPGTTKPPVKS